MTQYTLLNPLTGDSTNVHELYLTQNLRPNVILLRGDEPTGIITHRDIVLFCRWCAGRILSQCPTVPAQVHIALELVDKWLIDPGSIPSKELSQAAWATTRAVREAAWSAAVVRVADAAADTVRATQTAQAAWFSAQAVAFAADVVNVPFKAQAQWLVEHLKSAK